MQPETNYQENVTSSEIYKMYSIPGNSLSVNGYHLCIRNETRIVTFLAMHMVPYPVTESCGDWLLWKTCTVTRYRNAHQTEYKTVVEQVTRCCDGYVQVGRYCALRECAAHHFPSVGWEIVEERNLLCSLISSVFVLVFMKFDDIASLAQVISTTQWPFSVWCCVQDTRWKHRNRTATNISLLIYGL